MKGKNQVYRLVVVAAIMVIPSQLRVFQYREVAAAIVQHACWRDMMNMSATEAKTDDTEVPDDTEDKTLTPMRMLIEFMPGMPTEFYG